jgi:hypothetical protein
MISHITQFNVAHIIPSKQYQVIDYPQSQSCIYPSAHKSKNSVTIETGFLHSQKFTNNHYYFLIIAESVTFQVLCQQPKQMIYCILRPLEVLPLPKNNTFN